MSSNGKYLDYNGLVRLVENIEKKYAPIQAIRFVSTVDTVADLPALITVKAGWMYNIKTGGLTTADFIEGEGHLVSDGENVCAVELITGYVQVPTPYSATADPRVLGWYEVDMTTYNDVTASLDPADNPSAKGLYESDGALGFTPTADTTVVAGKHYFEQVITYRITEDRAPVGTKTYYEATKVMKWDILGGTFDLEGRYLEFGKEFPQGPPSRMVQNRTFLFMNENRYVYAAVNSPSGRPTEQEYFEGTFTAVTNTSDIVNPKQTPLYEVIQRFAPVTAVGSENPSALGWYESDGLLPPTYTLTADTYVQTGKTYYERLADAYGRTNDSEIDAGKTYYTGVFIASTDVVVDPAKIYYSEQLLYKKGGIYEYDVPTAEWNLQSSGAEVDPIPLPDIDELFI